MKSPDGKPPTSRTATGQTAPVARQLSVRAIIEAILKGGPTSRAGLAKLTGLSRQTTTQVVLELEREGWLRVGGRMQGPVGRSAPAYELNPGAAYVLGIRLEGAILQMALASLRGEITAELSERTDSEGGLSVVRQVGGLYRRLLAEIGIGHERVRFGTMGSPGVVDAESGHIEVAHSIPHLADINFVDALREELKLEIRIENGVKLAALGEMWQGAAKEVQNFVYFAVGSGIGMGIVSEGRLLRGARGAAGEIAYLPIGGDPFDPAGFAAGTFETAINSAALVRRYESYGGRPGQSALGVLEDFDAGKPAAIFAVEESARLIAVAICAVTAVLDLELVVMGGGLGAHGALVERVSSILPRIASLGAHGALLERAPWTLPRIAPKGLSIKASMLGDRAPLYGALGDALNRLHLDLFGVAVVGEMSLVDISV